MANTIPDPFAALKQLRPDLRITSQHRDAKKNEQVGGVSGSYHLTGQAIDIGRPNAEQASFVRQWAAANGMEVIGGYSDDHLHVEPAGNVMRQMVDMFKDASNSIGNFAVGSAITAANPSLGAIYNALPDKGDNDSPFAFISNLSHNWPRVLLVFIGIMILGIGVVILGVNSGSRAANAVLSSETGRNVARIAKLVI